MSDRDTTDDNDVCGIFPQPPPFPDEGTPEAVIADVVGDHMSGAERAFREHVDVAHEVVAALAKAGFKITKEADHAG